MPFCGLCLLHLHRSALDHAMVVWEPILIIHINADE
jgi:hypothetical protein